MARAKKATDPVPGSATLRTALAERPEAFLGRPPQDICESARRSVKYFIDPIATEFSQVFQDGIYLDGLDSLQIWEEARLVIDSVVDQVLDKEYAAVVAKAAAAEEELSGSGEDAEASGDEAGESGDETDETGDDADETGSFGSSEPEDGIEYAGDETFITAPDGFSSDAEMDTSALADEDAEDDSADDSADDSEAGGDEQTERGDDGGDEDEDAAAFVKDVHGLNDRFFDIDEFNKLTEAAELGDDDDDDDDDEIDYFADPDMPSLSERKAPRDDYVEDEHDYEAMDAADESEDYDEDDLENHDFGGSGSGANANEIKYNDFFAPPRKQRGRKPGRPFKARRQGDGYGGLGNDVDDSQLSAAMDEMRKDLFDEAEAESEAEFDEDGNRTSLSSFERMQAKLRAQIAKYEEQNVAKKDWTLMGEAKSKDRPVNSLLEEDMEFDRASKPVPVITKEVTDSLEDTIRKRIKTYDFDDLPRRLPDNLPQFRKSKLVDVDQSKSAKSLAELYEDDHQRQQAGEAHVEPQDEKLAAAHGEIEGLFKDVSFHLDALSSWHFTPKPAKPAVTIVANAPAIAMEDAQPAALSTEAMLAPHEVYNTAMSRAEKKEAGATDEVIAANGLPVARSEMTREEKKRRRRREKAKKAKADAARTEQRKARAQKAGSRADVLETLKKANVTVIGKRGEKRDVDGKLKVDRRAPKGSVGLKL
ncbi:U3 small nucleolar ribonucleoprotein complex, subunit Mpp10 [Dipodascopsis tothii]|uniref:U3 small nucleolar ribonucleoprotein complex, subunit Mpp10 n=1 Tax=Dipodascopsis tothii TaxID=44089 RepID=UPI0034CFF0C4